MNRAAPRRPRWPVVAVLGAALLLGGCGALKLLYGQASWLLTDYVTDLAELDDTQRRALVERADAVHAWHRQIELPAYARLLDDSVAALDGGLTLDETRALYARGLTRFQRIMYEIGDAVAPALAELSQAQVVALEDNLNAANEKFRDKYAAAEPEERKRKRRERVVDRFEQFVGDLSKRQREMVERAADEFPDSGPLWYEYRVAQQIRLLGLLKERRGLDDVRTHLRAWYGERGGRVERLETMAAELDDKVTRLVVAVAASLTGNQREELIENLQSYRDMARDLAGSS